MDIETRRKICQLVAGIIISDDLLDDAEEAFVDRLITSFGVGGEGRDVIFPLVGSVEAAQEIKLLSKDAQEEALRLLIEAACVDGQIAPEEREYLRTVASALDVRDATLARRVAEQLGTVSPTT